MMDVMTDERLGMTDTDMTFTRREARVEKLACVVGYDRANNERRLHRFRAFQDPAQAMDQHYTGVMLQWLARTMARQFPSALPVDEPMVDWSETMGDDWMRNRGRSYAHVRAIPDAPDELRGVGLRVARNVSVVAYMEPLVSRGSKQALQDGAGVA